GQARLRGSHAVVIGCGALGAIHAETLARAGVGRITLVDRDFVEESNLQRQIMFEEKDALERLPKAIAASSRIRRVNSDVEVEPVIADVTFENAEDLIRGAGVVLDGTDNFETRFLINDAAVKLGVPWVYGAVVGSYGLTMTVVPGQTPCLRCLLEALPDPATGPTCDTAGVITPIVMTIGAIQSAEALKLLCGSMDRLHGSLLRIDLWDFSFTRIGLKDAARLTECNACGLREFEYLQGETRQTAAALCGRNAVQITGRRADLDLNTLAERLRPLGDVACNEFLLRFNVDEFEITVFRDARSIIRGTDDVVVARNLYARYVGA
ncbi:MAG: ThiF family adenylyltransferase, partial [Blastocatellia bacterium]